MNLREHEYVVKIAEEGNLTKAAEKLFITPSALTQMINRLEQEIGAPLFSRSRNGWIPTEAGIIYLDMARNILQIQRESYKRLQDVVTNRKGTLSIGFPPERGSAMFTSTYPVFHRKYPGITINIFEISVRQQQMMISRGELDIGFLTLPEKLMTDDKYIWINSEELLLAVPAGHPLCKEARVSSAAPSQGLSFPEMSLYPFRYEPFALMYRGSTVRDLVEDIFRKEQFHPTILFETSRANTILDMVAARLCCGLVPSFYANSSPENVEFFSLPGHPSQNIMASYKKGSYLNQAARYFLELAIDYWK